MPLLEVVLHLPDQRVQIAACSQLPVTFSAKRFQDHDVGRGRSLCLEHRLKLFKHPSQPEPTRHAGFANCNVRKPCWQHLGLQAYSNVHQVKSCQRPLASLFSRVEPCSVTMSGHPLKKFFPFMSRASRVRFLWLQNCVISGRQALTPYQHNPWGRGMST